MRHCWLSEKASVSYEKLCSSSNTSHLYFTPSEMFSHLLFHLGPLQGVSRAGYREGKRKEIQAFLTLWKNRPDLLPLDFQAVLSSQVLLPPEPLLPDETSTLPRKPSLQASPGNYYCCSFWSSPKPKPWPPQGVTALKGLGLGGQSEGNPCGWGWEKWVSGFPGHLLLLPKIVVVPRGRGVKRLSSMILPVFFFF